MRLFPDKKTAVCGLYFQELCDRSHSRHSSEVVNVASKSLNRDDEEDDDNNKEEYVQDPHTNTSTYWTLYIRRQCK